MKKVHIVLTRGEGGRSDIRGVIEGKLISTYRDHNKDRNVGSNNRAMYESIR